MTAGGARVGPVGQRQGAPRKGDCERMNKTQVAGIIAGATVGLLGVAVGVALARQEGREAARKWLAQSGDLAQKSQQRAAVLGEQVRKTATEQATRIPERVNTLIATAAPQATAVLARVGVGGASNTATAAE